VLTCCLRCVVARVGERCEGVMRRSRKSGVTRTATRGMEADGDVVAPVDRSMAAETDRGAVLCPYCHARARCCCRHSVHRRSASVCRRAHRLSVQQGRTDSKCAEGAGEWESERAVVEALAEVHPSLLLQVDEARLRTTCSRSVSEGGVHMHSLALSSQGNGGAGCRRRACLLRTDMVGGATCMEEPQQRADGCKFAARE